MSRWIIIAALAAIGAVVTGCGVSDDQPESELNHDLSGKDFIRINDIYIVGGTDSDSATSGAATIVGVSGILVVDDEDTTPATYSLRVPIVDNSGQAIPHLEGTSPYAIDMQVRPGVLGSPTAYIPFDFSLAIATETITQ